MKVFVVIEWEAYEGEQLLAIFSTKEKAKAYLTEKEFIEEPYDPGNYKQKDSSNFHWATIEVVEIDVPLK